MSPFNIKRILLKLGGLTQKSLCCCLSVCYIGEKFLLHLLQLQQEGQGNVQAGCPVLFEVG